MDTSLDELKRGSVSFPTYDLDDGLSNDVSTHTPKNTKVGLDKVFPSDSMEINEKPPQEKKIEPVGLLTWLLSFFYTTPTVDASTDTKLSVNGRDYSNPKLRKPNGDIENRQMNNFIRQLKDENASRKEGHEDQKRSLDQQVVDMLLQIRDIKQILAQTISSEVFEHQKQNTQKKKEHQKVIDARLIASGTSTMLGRLQTGMGLGVVGCGLLTAIGVTTGTAPVLAIGFISNIVITITNEINKYKLNNLNVESIFNQKHITTRKEVIERYVDSFKAMLKDVNKSEQMTLSTIQKHQSAMTDVMQP